VNPTRLPRSNEINYDLLERLRLAMIYPCRLAPRPGPEAAIRRWLELAAFGALLDCPWDLGLLA